MRRAALAASTMVLLMVWLTGCAASGAPAGQVAPNRTAPQLPYEVGVRTFVVDAGSSRPLPVTVWYPAQGSQVAGGRFPVVLYSHGLASLPELHSGLTARWAAAGFVVAAPAYPHTRRGAAHFSRADVRNQPADGWRVIRHLIRLDRRTGDDLAGHLDMQHVAAAGHSAGGITTAGMFTSGHPARLRAGIVIAGGGMAGSFAGPSAPMLFVHGTADSVVPLSVGRAAYRRTPGPAYFLSLLGQGHGEYLVPGRPGFAQVLGTTTDFLRWTLYGDQDAARRLPTRALLPNITTFETRPAR
ncbi:alpha/beta hydrolase [Micromonospora endophytica]|uniref:alpha/beta hydrolase family protein n=1 Tax=Micromonospora endophytica TaxID=515350 RepID=UPI000E697E8A|nr:alpha/beta hydrolase [Micromonospora endophytica]RIW44536.1 alpha/beta hydrolase [Micromonospora endophytica]